MRLRLRARVLRARDGEFLYFHAPIFSFNLHLLNKKVLIDKSRAGHLLEFLPFTIITIHIQSATWKKICPDVRGEHARAITKLL